MGAPHGAGARLVRGALAGGLALSLALALAGALPAGASSQGVAAQAPTAVPAARSAVHVTLAASWHEFRKGEAVRLHGVVRRDGERARGVKVVLRARSGSAKASKVTTLRTNAKGKFVTWLRPTKDVVYTARAAGTESAPLRLDRTVGDRTIEDRAVALGAYLGAARSGVGELARTELKRLRTPRIASVRYRDHAQGMLVQVVKDSGKTRTWLVRGKILSAYRTAGGPDGAYGVPVADARCGLMERGCLQRFTGGALYEKKSQRKASGQRGRTKATELLAVARSQLSYRSSRLSSKYNAWTGSVGQPWCAAFQSWVASAAGSPRAIPKFARLHQLAPYARKKMTTFTDGSSKHKVTRGTLAFFDFRNGGKGPEPSHVGMVIRATRSTVVTLEGNASRSARFTASRGVFIHERPRSSVVFYAYPNW